MASQQLQLQEDLRDLIRGDLHADEYHRSLYSTDASIFQVEPLAVIVPRDEEEVQKIVRYAAEKKIPITARGGGTGLSGESLTSGIVLDFSRYFRAILGMDGETVRVQPGVVCRQLNDFLAPMRLRLAPDPATADQCTVGGMVATNASGPRALRHGYMRDYVVRLRCVLDTAEAVDFSEEPLLHGEEITTRKRQLVAGLAALLESHADLIRSCLPRTRFNRCGYLLHDVLGPKHLHMARMLVGTEGTLALVTEATLRVVPWPNSRAVLVVGFPSMEAALKALPTCLVAEPAACELLEHRLLTLTREVHPEYERVLRPGTQAALLVEIEGEKPGSAELVAESLSRALAVDHPLTGVAIGVKPEEIEHLWGLRNAALPLLYRLPGTSPPVPFVEDIAVPVEHLADLLHRSQELLRKLQMTASYLIHAGSGQVHLRPFLNIHEPGTVDRLQELAEGLYGIVLDLGGTISSQHGVGLGRTPWVARQYGRLYQVFREIKALFDPNNVFNPGKIVDLGNPTAPGKTLSELIRRRATAAPPGGWLLLWKSEQVAEECNRCNGCGSCRTESLPERMCPIFRVQHHEAAAPRAKANLLRALLSHPENAAKLHHDEVRAVADLCINCRMCALECPAKVNIPQLMLEAKAQNVAENGISWDDWALARTESLAWLGSAFADVVNPLLRSPTLRWLLEKWLGISRKRRLPAFARRSFLQIAERRGWTRPSRRPGVVYFVDVFANYNAPQIAEATVAVLHHHDIEVYVPPGQVGCGMAPLSVGDVDSARKAARQNVRVLAELVRSGYVVICSEPTAALMFKQDYPLLLEDPDAELIASRTWELTAFLADLQDQGRLQTEFRPLPWSVGHHVPCHLKALGVGVPTGRLLALIPRLRLLTIDLGCSGMAGTFGLKATSFETSLQAGRPMLERLRQRDVQIGVSECSACRMQMEQGTRKRCLHPIEVLAIAYGLISEPQLRTGSSLR
ncbi:MAG: anaerobic glycerol-3-phosphate dehydrogenase subunit C [Gemmatales bacterium]|nr:anaerobic glycerol-3-phosphate dehydrogenase subunit C [Gemmatales bacterium]MDW8385515.1 anaerobic glycerol-3-phosphate dehydrogenase subunit C [Gemmatales bacterium]